jgi:O-antigen ligase
MTATLGDRRTARVPTKAPPREAPPRAHRRARDDSGRVLSLYVVLLFGIPPIVVIYGLGAAGAPATLFGLALAACWAVTRLVPALGARGRQPIRLVVGLFVAVVVASYVAAGLRGYDAVEQRAADRGLLFVLGLAGVALVAADGLRTRDALDKVLHTVVLMGGVISVIGLLQFRFSFDVAALFGHVPGLVFNGTDNAIFTVGVRRVASTTGHPIEFGMVLTLILPIALHRAFYAAPGRRRRAWLLVALIGFGIPLSISRSAVVGLVVALAVLLPAWPRARRLWALKVLPVFLLVARLVAPGTLGTLWSGLTGIGNDPSVQGRADHRALVWRYIWERPFIGRGFGTFLPDRYVLLDNQYLGIMAEMGFIGLVVVIALFAVAIRSAFAIRRRTTDEETRDLAVSLAASVAAAAAGLATFDAFGFATFTGLLFLLLGCIGALWRMTTTSAPLPVR